MNMKKKGQITIFIIVAIIIVVLGILIYMFYPQIKASLGFEAKNPQQYIKSCVEEDLEDILDKVSIHGGSLNPEHYIMYQGETIEYLCYTGEYYKTCVMQQANLKKHIEEEVADAIQSKASDCFNQLKSNYEKQGYNVNLKKGATGVELLPKRVAVTFNTSVTLTKEGSEKYDSFSVILNNNLYELVSITNSILNWEARYGDAETTIYMDYYRDLKVEKKKQTEGSTVYILTDLNNGKKFQFASRSVAWPAGYGE